MVINDLMDLIKKLLGDDYKAYLIKEGVDKEMAKIMAKAFLETGCLDIPDCIFED